MKSNDIRPKSAAEKCILLAIMMSALMVMVCATFRAHAFSDEWEVTNGVSWQITVHDHETEAQATIQPEQVGTLARGSAGRLEVYSPGNDFAFQSDASRVTILELFKGQLSWRADEKVCGDCEEDRRPNSCRDCRYCQQPD